MLFRIKNFTFVVIFFISLSTQWLIWSRNKNAFTDGDLWISRVEYLSHDLFGHEHIFSQDHYSEHPGMPVLIFAAVTHSAGLSSNNSLVLAVSTINALTITTIAKFAKKARPNTPWWAAASSIILLHPLYVLASPVDAVVSPLFVLIFCIVLLITEGHENKRMDFALSLALGLAMATRFHVTAIIVAPLVIFMTLLLGWKKMLTIIILAITWATAMIPLLWFIPREFLTAMIQQYGFFTGTSLNRTVTPSLTIEYFLFFAPFTILSMILSLMVLRLGKTKLAKQRNIIVLLIICTITSTGAFLIASLQSIRYFFPLIFIWDTFLPLWLLTITNNIHYSDTNVILQKKINALLPWGIVGITIGSQLFLLLYLIAF